MAINPINGISVPSTLTPTPAVKPTQGEQKVNFNEALDSAINKVNNDQQSLGVAIEDLLAGRTQDVVPAVAAMAEADISFKLLMGVRNKVIEAYKQTMNMQI